MKNKFFLFVPCSLFFIPVVVSAATSIFLDPADTFVNLHDTFAMNIRIDTGGECVNAIDAKIKFDHKVLKAIDFGRGQSLISLWIVPPKIDQEGGIISFSGGIPGGYCGRVVGDPGLSNVLGKIIFTPLDSTLASTTTRVEIADESEILLNDGLGTKAEASYKGTVVTITSGVGTQNTWLSEIRSDTVAPEPFVLELDREPTVYGGKYFIAWSTMDKQSGIDHYEVLETDPWKFGFFNFIGNGERKTFWTRTESPYVLQDQNLRSKILVKAVDKIGNERIAELNPETSVLQKGEAVRMWIIVTGILSLFVFAITAWRMRKKK